MYVFGYGSLVALDGPDAIRGRLRGFRRHWGVAMNNWQGGDGVKHYLDPDTGERPRIRVAYLDLYEQADSAVNGIALPVDRERLETLDAREVNYQRVDVTAAFEPAEDEAYVARAYTYLGLPDARERCRKGAVEANVFVRQEYVTDVRRAFESLDALAEFDRTTDPCPFFERNLKVIPAQGAAGQADQGRREAR